MTISYLLLYLQTSSNPSSDDLASNSLRKYKQPETISSPLTATSSNSLYPLLPPKASPFTLHPAPPTSQSLGPCNDLKPASLPLYWITSTSLRACLSVICLLKYKNKSKAKKVS